MKVVYEHWLDNKCIYVGYGEPSRPYSTHRSSRYWDVVGERFNELDICIIKEFDNVEDAKAFEIEQSLKRRLEGHPVIGYIGQHPDEEAKRRLSIANTGKKRTELTKQNKSNQVKQQWSDGVYNNRHIDYSKVSNSLKGHIVSEETKQKISNTLRGRNIPEETKQKISNTLKERYKHR